MKIFLDCLPCMLKQVLEASRMTTDDIQMQDQIMNEAIKTLQNYKQYCNAPDLAVDMHNIVKKYTNKTDPYEMIKDRDIKAALKVYPFLKVFLKDKNNSLYWALKIAATGNIIDSAIYNNVDIENCIENELKKEFGVCDIESFEKKLNTAKKVLIIGDNSGETVFDRVLIENLKSVNVTYAVRNNPIINDVTLDEAVRSGLDECSTIISTGCNAPGAILSQCSQEFMNTFNNADIVISKGQGNFEALSDCEREVYFLLKAKCPMISNKFNVPLSSYVFKKHN